MAKEEGAENAPQKETAAHIVYKTMIEEAFRMACNQEGGLELPISLRGHREVKETMKFGPETTVEALVNAQNFDVTLMLNGDRYQTQQRGGSPELIKQANNFVSSGGGFKFRFDEKITFRTSAAQRTEAATAA